MSNLMLDQLDGQLLDGLEFCSRVYALFESIREAPDGPSRLRRRASLTEKRVLEELLPICRYVQHAYRAGRYIRVRWHSGSQSYDAELHQSGVLVDRGHFAPLAYLEATCAMHENEHWTWKLLDQGLGAFAPEGIVKVKGKPVQSQPFVFHGNQHVLSFAPLVVSSIQKKAAIPYPEHTSLVIQCLLNTLYTPDEWRQLVVAVEAELSAVPFEEVLLFDGTTERATALSWER